MYLLNKIVWSVLNPENLGLMVGLAGGMCVALKWRRTARGLLIAAVAWLWLWAMPATLRVVGMPLESDYLSANTGRMPTVDELPNADAIVILGGGVGGRTNVSDCAQLWPNANRVWHAARLFKAGKAPKVIPSGRNECRGTMEVLCDFGVPRERIVWEDKARNTEENARELVRLLAPKPNAKPKILLVTSAWHMRRSELMFRKFAPELEVVPAPCDFRVTLTCLRSFSLAELLPSADALNGNCLFLHEWLGYWAYRWFR